MKRAGAEVGALRGGGDGGGPAAGAGARRGTPGVGEPPAGAAVQRGGEDLAAGAGVRTGGAGTHGLAAGAVARRSAAEGANPVTDTAAAAAAAAAQMTEGSADPGPILAIDTTLKGAGVLTGEETTARGTGLLWPAKARSLAGLQDPTKWTTLPRFGGMTG